MSFTGFQQDKYGKAEVSDPSSVLNTVPIRRGEGSSTGEHATASDVLAGAFDPARLHPLAGLGDKLDYLILEDEKTNSIPGSTTALPSRGFNDDLCYGTGTTYLAGLGVGGLWGIREGVRRPLVVSNPRLRINSVLNSVTRRGTFLGNSAGVLALMYNAINSTIDGVRGKHDALGSMAAGGVCGLLYRSTAGLRPALAAAALMTGAAGVWSQLKRMI